MRQTLNRATPIDFGGAVTQVQSKPIGPAGGLALTLAFSGLAIASTWIAASLANQAQLAQAQQALRASEDRAAAANIAADKARATLASNQAQIKAFCTATGGAPNGKH